MSETGETLFKKWDSISQANQSLKIKVLILIALVIVLYLFFRKITSLTIDGDVNIENGNLTVTGDGNLTGAVKAKYFTLRDYTNDRESYIYADKDTLLWEQGPFSTQPYNDNDLLGWKSKLQQTTFVQKLEDNPSLSNIVSFHNTILDTLFTRGVIFSAPQPPEGQVNNFDVIANVQANGGSYPPVDNSSFNGSQGIRRSVLNGDITFPENLVNISKIQSIQMNFVAIQTQSGFGGQISDARVALDLSGQKQVFYAFYSTVRGGLFVGCQVSTTGYPDIPISSDPAVETGDLFITDQAKIAYLLSAQNNGDLLRTLPINVNWTCGYPYIFLSSCTLTRFIINYFI